MQKRCMVLVNNGYHWHERLGRMVTQTQTERLDIVYGKFRKPTKYHCSITKISV